MFSIISNETLSIRLFLLKNDSSNIPYTDESFDKVFCNMVLYFWDQPELHLQEIHRILKTGGKFYTGFRPKESMFQFPFIDYGFSLYNFEDWIGLLEQNGMSYAGLNKRQDPPMDNDDQVIQLGSLCMVAEKL